tara:strand:+ start:848 stop:1054 length:207 start_codon:yes stop_codon:yes gene_type:complete
MSSKTNLEDHKVFIESHQMEMIPYSVAVKAIQEAFDAAQMHQINQAIETLSRELTSMSPDLSKLKDNI